LDRPPSTGKKERVEIINGKTTRVVAASELASTIAGYRDLLIDLGTGDGRYVTHMAWQNPAVFVIGVDACRENLRDASRTRPGNSLFAIANLAIPGCTFFEEMRGFATQVTINFPWGSLRDALLAGEPALLGGLWKIMRPGARLEIHLNASALAEAGWDLHAGGSRVAESLANVGLEIRKSKTLSVPGLRALPSTWARRLAFGRDPHAVWILAQKTAVQLQRKAEVPARLHHSQKISPSPTRTESPPMRSEVNCWPS
jgi:16S rRNA (adenine(1408)-N(1))-methyltransferase